MLCSCPRPFCTPFVSKSSTMYPRSFLMKFSSALRPTNASSGTSGRYFLSLFLWSFLTQLFSTFPHISFAVSLNLTSLVTRNRFLEVSEELRINDSSGNPLDHASRSLFFCVFFLAFFYLSIFNTLTIKKTKSFNLPCFIASHRP